ncbi:hypothetical protein HDA40_001168 [Hamadaea flava]|nr:hypothetical protein [Hamadaea flava]
MAQFFDIYGGLRHDFRVDFPADSPAGSPAWVR